MIIGDGIFENESLHPKAKSLPGALYRLRLISVNVSSTSPLKPNVQGKTFLLSIKHW